MRAWKLSAVGVLAAALVVAPPAPSAMPAPVLQARASDSATVVSWSDGDTVVTSLGTVRLIGFNAPDKGECGYGAARRSAKKLAPVGSTVALVLPSGHDDVDHYGRLLRYVSAGGKDVGIRQIRKGSVAKYDSTDGYDAHPKQRRYRKVDIKSRDYCGNRDLKSYAPVSETSCPAKAPIKGNRGDTWIYHLPSNQYYSVTRPEECFASGDGAKKHGYRASLV